MYGCELEVDYTEGTQGAIYWGTAMVSPNTTARSRPPLLLACSGQKFWTKAATHMDGLTGSQQLIVSVCGKVPYRLSGGFRPVKQLPFPCLPDTADQPTRRYNHKDFERSLADSKSARGNEKKRVGT